MPSYFVVAATVMLAGWLLLAFKRIMEIPEPTDNEDEEVADDGSLWRASGFKGL